MNTRIKIYLIALLSLSNVFAQKEISYSSDWGEKLPSFPNHLILKSNVVFVHEGMTMTCDSAVFNTQDNLINAYHNIHIYQDTLHLYGDEFFYDANIKVAEVFGDTVILHDDEVILQTDYMVMDRVLQTVRYTNHADIWDKENTLESQIGTYFIEPKTFEFAQKVKIKTPKAEIFSDSIFYNSRNDDAILYENNLILSDSKLLKADSIHYNTKTEFSKAFKNVYINDSVNQLNAYSSYLEKNEKDSIPYVFLCQDILVEQVDNKDTLFLHCDSIWINFDTAMNAEEMFAYQHVKFYREDMQGVSDYLYYDVKDSLVYFLGEPVLWSEANQFTADTISLKLEKKSVKQMFMYPNVLIAQNSDTNSLQYFNQISGKKFTADFKKNKITYAIIENQVKSIFYFWEEGKNSKKLTGVNIGESSMLNLYFEKGRLKKMTAIDMPKFFLDDYERIEEEKRNLKGFIWFEEQRPMSKSDIFQHRD